MYGDVFVQTAVTEMHGAAIVTMTMGRMVRRVDRCVMAFGNQMLAPNCDIAKFRHMDVNLTTAAMVMKLHDARHCDNGEHQHCYMAI